MITCREDVEGAPCGSSLPLAPLWRLEAAGSSPSMEAAVVNMPQIHAHQPEPHGCILYGCELQLHIEVDRDQHLGHIT